MLKSAQVRTVLDIRLNNTSQLAGFAKQQDLPYFLDRLCDAAYVEMPELAPEPDLLKRYQAKQLTWDDFTAEYIELIAKASCGKQSGCRSIPLGLPALQ